MRARATPRPPASAAEAPSPPGRPQVGAPGLPAHLASELSNQFDAVIDFADYCAFLTDGRLAALAERLADLAHEIYAATRTDLLQDRRESATWKEL